MPMLAIRSSTGILQSTGKRIFRDGTQTYRQMTEKHCNLETKSAKRVDSVKSVFFCLVCCCFLFVVVYIVGVYVVVVYVSWSVEIIKPILTEPKKLHSPLKKMLSLLWWSLLWWTLLWLSIMWLSTLWLSMFSLCVQIIVAPWQILGIRSLTRSL